MHDAAQTGLPGRLRLGHSNAAYQVEGATSEGDRGPSIWDALATDMEPAALAHTCHLYDVPFLSVRGISDLCGPHAGKDFKTQVDDAADRSATIVIGTLREFAVRY